MENITENNKLLAEFLGWKREKVVKNGKGRLYDFLCPEHIEVIGESDSECCSDCGRDTYRKNYLFGEDLLFHNDWNWLMEVVEKIEETNLGSLEMQSKNLVLLQYNRKTEKYYNSTLIENVYNACTQFVKWYNKENK